MENYSKFVKANVSNFAKRIVAAKKKQAVCQKQYDAYLENQQMIDGVLAMINQQLGTELTLESFMNLVNVEVKENTGKDGKTIKQTIVSMKYDNILPDCENSCEGTCNSCGAGVPQMSVEDVAAIEKQIAEEQAEGGKDLPF